MGRPADIEPISVTIQQAASLTGISHDVIERAIRANALVAHYPSSRPVILLPDLHSWLKSSPTESPRRFRYRPRPG